MIQPLRCAHLRVWAVLALAGGLMLYLGVFLGIRISGASQRHGGNAVHPRPGDGGAAAAARHPMYRTSMPAGPPIPAAFVQYSPTKRRHEKTAGSEPQLAGVVRENMTPTRDSPVMAGRIREPGGGTALFVW